MIRRLLVVSIVALAGLLFRVDMAGAHVARPPAVEALTTISTAPPAVDESTEHLPGTTLEAEARDDGTPQTPWLIGSAIAAAAVVAIGGAVLKRRMR